MDFVEQLKASVDIANVVGEYVKLRRAGANRYMGLCPFHQEKSPSFTVHIVHQFYKCFSCGASGDMIKFVMEKEGISFYEALKSLSERYGIPMPKRSNYADEDAKARGSLLAMHEQAADNFRENLRSAAGEAARAYLAKRGLSQEMIEHFGLGYADRSGRALIRLFEQQRFPVAQMEASGLVGRRQDGSLYDRFRNRLMFPIHNESGKVIAFGGRALSDEDQPKYLNSPETDLYKKSNVLYNLHRAKEPMRKADRAILVEGYMDAIGVTAAGFGNVVASCGTALTDKQVQAIKRFTHRVAVNFDPDTAGANASERSIDMLLAEGMQMRIVELEDGLDPDEFCKKYGSEVYAGCIENAKGYFYWLADRARTKHDTRTPEGKVAVLEFLLPKVQRISDPLERLTIANEVAGYLGVNQGMVLDRFRKAASEKSSARLPQAPTPLRHDERMLLHALLAGGEEAPGLIERLRELEVLDTLISRRLFQAMFAIADNGGPISFNEVHARLEGSDQDLLAQAVLREDGEISPEEISAALNSMVRTEDQGRRERLKARIHELERNGQLEEALRAIQELQGLERSAAARR